MGLFRKKKKPTPLTREQALACTPVRNNVTSWKRLESGVIQIEYILTLKPFHVSIFRRFTKERTGMATKKLELDKLGSQVWELVDGTRTTADVIQEFAAAHDLTIREAEHSVTLFLRQLGTRGLIALY